MSTDKVKVKTNVKIINANLQFLFYGRVSVMVVQHHVSVVRL